MNFDELRGDIGKRFEGFNKEQISRIAWLCGVRAFPFLCGDSQSRGFTYWPEDVRQKHLYSVLNALDVSSSGKGVCFLSSDDAHAADDAAYAVNRASGAAEATANAAAYAAANTDVYAAFYATEYANEAANYARTSLEQILYDDLETIRTGNLDTLNNNTDIYGEIWPNYLSCIIHWFGHFKRGRCGKMLLSNKLQRDCNTFYQPTTKHSVP